MLFSHSVILAEAICMTIRPELKVPTDLFYLHTTIRQKHMVLFHLIFLFSQPFEQKLRSSLICFFYLHTTNRQKYMVLFQIFSIFFAQPFEQKLESSLIYFLYVHTTIWRKYILLFHFFYPLCTTIRPKISVLIDLFLLFVRDHSTKLYGPLSFILSLVHHHSTKN